MSVNGNDYLHNSTTKVMWTPNKSNNEMKDFLHVINKKYDLKLGELQYFMSDVIPVA